MRRRELRRKSSRGFGVTAVLLALAMVLAACDAADEVAEDPDAIPGDDDTDDTDDTDVPDDDDADDDVADDGERHVMRYASFAGDAGQIDPHFASAGQDRLIVGRMFNGLVRMAPENFAEFEPDLAVELPSGEVQDDGTQTWEFELREGVMCHEGPETDAYEFTAADAVYSLEKAMDSERSGYAGNYGNFASVEADGDYNVTITLEEPRSPSLFFANVADFAGGYMVCSEAVEAMGDEDFGNHPVGTGPFKFQDYVPGERVEMVANDDYWRGEPGLAGIDVMFMPDDSSRELALINRDVDAIFAPRDMSFIERVDQEDGITATYTPFGGSGFFAFDTEHEILGDELVREAIILGIDEGAHIALSGEGIIQPGYSIGVPDMGPGGLTEEEAEERGVLYGFDPERAQELLAEAGYPDGFELELTASEHEEYLGNYEILQAEMNDIGIDITLDVVDHSTMHATIREGANAIVYYFAPRPSHQDLLHEFFHSDSQVVTGENPITNFTNWGGADELIEAAANETDDDAQVELWKDAYTAIAEEKVAHLVYSGGLGVAWHDGFDWGRELGAEIESSHAVDERATLTR